MQAVSLKRANFLKTKSWPHDSALTDTRPGEGPTEPVGPSESGLPVEPR